MYAVIDVLFIITIVVLLVLHVVEYFLYQKLKNIPNDTDLTGFEIADKISTKLALKEPHIIKKKGMFLDHYNNKRNVIKLSPLVFDGNNMYSSIMAIIVALESKRNSNIVIKNNLCTFTCLISYLIIIIGALITNNNAIYIGLGLFIIAIIFHLLFCNIYLNNKEEINEIINKEKLLEKYNEKDIFILSLIKTMTIPYKFIDFFR